MRELSESPICADEVIRACPEVRVEYHPQIGSTNDRARQLAAAADTPTPYLVVAERQTAGRGRGDNRWWTGRGSLAFSLLVQAPVSVPRREFGLFALAAGSAVCDAVVGHTGNRLQPMLRWPNDVLLQRRKLAGILVETTPGNHLVIGIGVNVNNSSEDAPALVRSRLVTLRDVLGTWLDRTRLLAELVALVLKRMGPERWQPSDVARRAHRLCADRGRSMTVDRGGTRVSGVCRGISADGALLLEVDGRLKSVFSGSVVEVEERAA